MNSAPPAPVKSATPPFAFFEWMIARRYLGTTRSGKGVSLISIIAFVGIALAVAVLISVMSIMQGFRSQLLDQLLGVNGHVFVESQAPIEGYDETAARLAELPDVIEAAPMIELPVFATARGEAGLVVRGLRREDLMKIDYVTGADHVVGGSFDTFGLGEKGGNEIAIGSRTAWTLGVGPGDNVTFLSGRGPATAFGPTPRKKTYKVGAIFHVGNSEYDSFIAFMPLEQAQLFFNYGEAVQKIQVRITDPEMVKAVRPEIVDAVRGYNVIDWQEQNQSYFNALEIERFAMRIILLLILLVAALNIVTGLIMLVKDKTGDIAILRTMGATKGAIMRIFFLSGSLIGVLGVIGGLILGVLFVVNIDAIEGFLSMLTGTDLFPAEVYYLDGVPAEMQFSEVAIVVGATLAMSFLTTLYPAWRAAKLDPVEALRYE